MSQIASVLMVFVFLALNYSIKASASEDQKKKIHIQGASKTKFPKLGLNIFGLDGGIDLYERTQYIFEKVYGLQPEPSYQSELDALSQKQSLSGLNKFLKYFDSSGQFSRFSAFEGNGPGVIHVYQDRDLRKSLDYAIPLSQKALKLNPFSQFRPTPNQPLAGLRIALDPGHMGGEIWDQRTGKYVTDHKGQVLSEGILNLQTCLLLKERLEREGATVLVTHNGPGPVTAISWESLNLSQFIPDELHDSSLEPWFVSLLEEAPPGKELSDAFSKSPHIKRIFSEEARSEYFILKEDLNARAKMIEAFRPDITLVVHYDTDDPPKDPNGLSKIGTQFTKAYVAGGFLPAEFASRAFRRDFAKHVFEPFWWKTSVKLAHYIVSEMSHHLNVKPQQANTTNTVGIEPGVSARNLNLTRQIADSALAYVECLYYNDPKEFTAFSKQDHFMTMGGVNYFYSNRLVQVVDGLESGVLKFAENLNLK